MSSVRRPDRPTTLSRPVLLPSCCNFRRQPWTTYVHGEFNYSATPRCYDGVDRELGTAADNEEVIQIIESLQQPSHGNGCHSDNSVNSLNSGEHEHGTRRQEDNSQTNGGVDSSSQNARKSSPEIASVQLTTDRLSCDLKDGLNGLIGINGVVLRNNSREDEKATVVSLERPSVQLAQQDINQNLRQIDDPVKHSDDVGPETDCQCETETETGNSRHRPLSPATGSQQKCKPRRSRNRSLTSRDDRLTNGGAESRRNQHGGRKSVRSRTLSPALTQRFDYHVSRPIQTESHEPEVQRRDVIVSCSEVSSVCFRPGVHRKSRVAAAAGSKTASERAISGVSDTSSPNQSRRYSCSFTLLEHSAAL